MAPSPAEPVGFCSRPCQRLRRRRPDAGEVRGGGEEGEGERRLADDTFRGPGRGWLVFGPEDESFLLGRSGGKTEGGDVRV